MWIVDLVNNVQDRNNGYIYFTNRLLSEKGWCSINPCVIGNSFCRKCLFNRYSIYSYYFILLIFDGAFILYRLGIHFYIKLIVSILQKESDMIRLDSTKARQKNKHVFYSVSLFGVDHDLAASVSCKLAVYSKWFTCFGMLKLNLPAFWMETLPLLVITAISLCDVSPFKQMDTKRQTKCDRLLLPLLWHLFTKHIVTPLTLLVMQLFRLSGEITA